MLNFSIHVWQRAHHSTYVVTISKWLLPVSPSSHLSHRETADPVPSLTVTINSCVWFDLITHRLVNCWPVTRLFPSFTLALSLSLCVTKSQSYFTPQMTPLFRCVWARVYVHRCVRIHLNYSRSLDCLFTIVTLTVLDFIKYVPACNPLQLFHFKRTLSLQLFYVR